MHLDGDRQRAARRVTANQRDTASCGERAKAIGKTGKPGFMDIGQGERQGKPQRPCAHGGQIAQIHRKCPVTDRPG